jgi:hypothetical protein
MFGECHLILDETLRGMKFDSLAHIRTSAGIVLPKLTRVITDISSLCLRYGLFVGWLWRGSNCSATLSVAPALAMLAAVHVFVSCRDAVALGHADALDKKAFSWLWDLHAKVPSVDPDHPDEHPDAVPHEGEEQRVMSALTFASLYTGIEILVKHEER